jgi:putative SOS response-associated peptidase YedK
VGVIVELPEKKSCVGSTNIPIPPQRDLPISYNIAPSQDVSVIRFNPATSQRSLDALQWGLIPHWAEDKRIAFRTINARRETLDTAPSFKKAFRRRRCLIPADGFYEWGGVERDPSTGEWLRTCTIITGDPNELVSQVHTRMPVILPVEHHSVWLGETEDGDLRELLKPYPSEEMKM